MQTISLAGITLSLDTITQQVTLLAHGKMWQTDPDFRPFVDTIRAPRYFDEAFEIVAQVVPSGLGVGLRARYTYPDMIFETNIHIDSTDGHVDFQFVPIHMPDGLVKGVQWPAPLVADEKGSYALINYLQGTMIPTDWAQEANKLPFGGQLCCCGAYMPWFGEVTPEGGYIATSTQPWDTAYRLTHPAGGPTRLGFTHLPSLGRMAYDRTIRYDFTPAGSDYVTLAKLYRAYAIETGLLITLKEKQVRSPHLSQLIGSCVAHMPTKSNVTTGSSYYNYENPEKNRSVVPFAHNEVRMREFKAMGVDKLYLHLDGWGDPGYDNQHPDYLPACEEAGGWAGMKALSDTMQELNYLFGIHDQYRDYYLDAPSYTPDDAVMLADGDIYEMARWAGGKQKYLCSALQPAYVKRNFEELIRQGIRLQATYLDVFTCNEPDECINPRHVVTRKQSLDYRKQCFDYLISRGILPSSEEVADWAMQSLVFSHWAPYHIGYGHCVPLFNLVYHDCIIIPWEMSRGTWGIPETELGFLHALLGGGIPYIEMGKRPVGDADWDVHFQRVQTVQALHEKIAHAEMLTHAFLSDDKSVQRTVFSDGTTVTVDFKNDAYTIA